MGLLIGMDEAGYGPNLGPLVITATAWQVPGPPAETDLWDDFSDAITSRYEPGDIRLHVADSKLVYSPSTGLDRLERGVLSALKLLSMNCDEFPALCRRLVCEPGELDGEDCLADADLPLPHCPNVASAVAKSADRWRSCCDHAGVRLLAIQSDVVWTRRWNGLLKQHGNKAAALSRLSLQLLRRLWEPGGDEPALIVGDKHGGRNRYDTYLQEITDGEMIFRLEERREISRYRVGKAEIRFQMRGESHLPVALASMVSKYIRELSMVLFNRFWAKHVPGVKPTKGYPVDAKRFRADIAEAQRALEIPDEALWRER